MKINAALGKKRQLYIMMIPGILYYLIFHYSPMFNVIIAFQNYNMFLGYFKSPWVGFAHFKRLFADPNFGVIIKNTVIIGILNIVFYFPVPIILALLLHEVRITWYKRLTQTFIYIPHFISWVVVYSITYVLLTVDGGIINNLLSTMNKPPIRFLTSKEFFRPLLMIQLIWKEAGWGTIIFLAALTAIDPELYNAADVDGASRLQKLFHITLPGIKSTIAVLLILRIGGFLNSGFEQIMLLVNALTRGVGEVFDTYIYLTGISNGQYSYTTAMGLFKSVISLILIMGANWCAKKIGEEGIY